MYTVGQQIGINAASSAIGGLIGVGTSYLQHRYNRNLAEYQNAMNIENWNMQNEYNSPVSQRKRLEDAGLNPALMYGGNGSVSTGNASQMPAYQNPSMDISNNILQGMQMAQMYANIRKTNAEATKTELENPYVGATAQAILDNYIADTELTKEQKNKVVVEQKQLWKSMEKMDVDIAEVNKRIELMNSDIQLRIAQAKTESEKAKYTEAQRQLVVLQQAIAKVEEQNAKKQGELIDHQKGAVDAQKAASYAAANASNTQAAVNKETKRVVSAQAVQAEWKKEWRSGNGVDPDANWFQIPMQVVGSCLNNAVNYFTRTQERRQARRQKAVLDKANETMD